MKTIYFSFLFYFLFVAESTAQTNVQKQSDSIAYHYHNILNPKQSTDVPNAIKFYDSLKLVHLKENKIYEAIEDLRLIAIGQNKIGYYFDSEVSTVEALKLIEESSESDTLIESRKGLYNQLGKNYRTNFQYENSLIAYNNALKFSRTLKDSITILNNKATIFKDLKQYSKALEQLNLALNKKIIEKNMIEYAMILDNLGMVQFKLNDTNALYNLNKALQIREGQKNLSGIYSSNKSLAIYYFDRNEKKQALHYANKAYAAAMTLNSITYIDDALSLFVTMSEDPKIVAFKTINDSITKQKQLAENKNAFIKYNVEKEKEKTAEAKLQQQKEKGQKLLFLILGISILILAVLVILLLRSRHKKEKIIQVHKTEARISKKVHDEVANDVYQLMAKLQGKYRDDEKIMDALEVIYNKTRDISKENSAIEIGNDFSEQLKDLLLSYETDRTAISTRYLASLDWKIVPKIKKETIYRVLQELMTNMKKYSNATAVLLTFHQNGKKITIDYTDNGIGCILKNKNGLQNVENRIHALKGSIIFDSEPGNGFRSKIRI